MLRKSIIATVLAIAALLIAAPAFAKCDPSSLTDCGVPGDAVRIREGRMPFGQFKKEKLENRTEKKQEYAELREKVRSEEITKEEAKLQLTEKAREYLMLFVDHFNSFVGRVSDRLVEGEYDAYSTRLSALSDSLDALRLEIADAADFPALREARASLHELTKSFRDLMKEIRETIRAEKTAESAE